MVARSTFTQLLQFPLRCTLLFAGLLLPAFGAAHPHGPGNGGSAPPENPETKVNQDLLLEVTLARRAKEPTQREAYVRDLVELALNAAGVEHVLSAGSHDHDHDELMHSLTDEHHEANLAVAPPDDELTQKLRPVYFPVHRGLPGHRLLVIPEGDQERFGEVVDLDALREMTAAVRAGSGDRAFMEHNRLRTIAVQPGGLADAIAQGRVDYAVLPPERALAVAEDDSRVTLEKTLVLAYVGDDIFYVNPNAEDLVAALDEGLMAAHRDGTLAEFQQMHPYLNNVLKATGLEGRRTLILDHPDMPRALQRAPAELWLQR